MFDVPVVGGVLFFLALVWLLAMDGFMGTDGSPVPPAARAESAVRRCVAEFNIAPVVRAAGASGRLVGYPDHSCRLRIDGGPGLRFTGGRWEPDATPTPLPGPANAYFDASGWIRLR